MRWVAGFWTNAVDTNKVQVLPAPPETLEQGPTVAQPSEDHFWIPGSWQYRNSRYAWRPGFWSPCQQNWVWVPEHYRWHPQGCVHVAGYWDYHWSNRGTLFAPTYFSSNIYRTAGYRYRPSVVVSLGSAFDHLWIRPGYSHYFIGDYYSNYNQRGYIPWYSYASRTRYYDPLFAYQRWALRHSIHDLHHHYHQRHNHYHRYVDHRPFHTYRDFHHHHRRNSRVNISQSRRNTTTAPPSRLTGSAFVSRVDDIVRQQHRDRHAGKRGSQVVTNRGGQGTRGSSRTNTSVYRGNSNRGHLLRNARNIADIKAVTNAGTKTNKPNGSNNRNRGTNRPNVSTNVRGNGKRPQVKPNSAFVKSNANQNRNQGKGSKPNAQVRRPAPAKTSSPPTRTLITKPRTTTPNTYVTKPRVTPPNNTRPNVANPRSVVTRPRVTNPNSNSGSNTTNRSAVNRNFVTRGTSPSTSQKVRSAVQSSPRPTTQANKTNTRTVQPQRVQPQRVQTPRPNTTSRAQQFSRSRQQPSSSVRSQPRTQTSRSQAFRASVSRPPTVRQPSVRNVRPNVRSTPQRVTPQRVQPQRSIQRSSPSRNVRPTPRPSVNMNRGAGFSRSRASTPRSTPSRGSSFRGNKR